MMRAGLFGSAGLTAGRMTAGKASNRMGVGSIGYGRKAPNPQPQPQERRGLLSGGRRDSFLGNIMGFMNAENNGSSNWDQLQLAAAMMRDDPSYAASQQQNLDRQQTLYQQRQQSQQAAQQQQEAARREAEERRQMLEGQARQLGMDPAEYSMLPETTRNEMFARRYTPEEQEPNLREFGGNMYDFSDPQNPRMVMQGQQPRQDLETVVIDGRLVNRRTGELVADYRDPNASADLTEQERKFGMLSEIAVNSNAILDEVEAGEDGQFGTADDFQFNRGSATVAGLQNNNTPVLGGAMRGVGEMFPAPQTRRAYDAYLGITEAYLRATTGAQAPEPEIVRAMSQIVPRPGDTAEVRADKQRRRREWQAAIDRAAGAGAREQTNGGRSSGGSFDSMSDEELERIANGG